MTADSDRDEVYATADEDSMIKADPGADGEEDPGDPRGSVTDAATFLEETTTALVASIEQLRSEWDRDGLDTEDLRNILRRYRGMLERIAAL